MPPRISSTASVALQIAPSGGRATAPRSARPSNDGNETRVHRSAPSSAHRTLSQKQTQLSQGQQREQMLERVDQLVARLEVVANRITSPDVSTTQRTVLVARFNDLQRQVNELDGIFGSEGRGDGNQGTLTQAVVSGQGSLNLNVEDSQDATSALEQIRSVRGEIQTRRQDSTARTRQDQRNVAETLANVQQTRAPARPSPETVSRTQEAIRTQGTQVIDNQPSNSSAVDLLA